MEHRKITLSKKLLKEALLELLQDKALYQISVRELCSKADLNRSTFYKHYEDINYLIADIEKDILDDIPFMNYAKEKSQQDILSFANFIEKNKSIVMTLVKNGRLVSSIVDASVNLFLQEGKKTEEEIEIFKFLSHYCLGGMLQALDFFMKEGKTLTVNEISDIIYKLFIDAENYRKSRCNK